MASEVVEASGHLIDSGLLNGIFDTVIRHNASFEVIRFTIGKSNDEPSVLRMRVTADTEDALRAVVENLVPLGCLVGSKQDATTQVAEQDGCAPDDFYSTTNHETHIRKGGKWTLVEEKKNDGTPEDAVMAMVDSELLDELLGTLDKRARYAIEARFGLLDGERKSFREVGENLGVTAEAARRLVSRAVAGLREDAVRILAA